MEMTTPPVLVALVRRLLPSADREHVLGDLQERREADDSSGRRYFVDVMQTVPLVIWSRMRRTLTQAVFAIQPLLILAAFVAVLTSQRLGGNLLLVFRTLFPALIATSVLLVADTYATPGRRQPWRQLAIVAIALGVVWCANALGFRFGIPWTLPYQTMSQGLFISFLLLSWARFMRVFREAAHEHLDRAVPSTVADLRAHTESFEREIRQRNQMAYVICAVLIITFGRVALLAATQIAMVGALLTVAGTLWLGYQVSRFPSAPAPGHLDFANLRQFYARELHRQRAFHSASALWLRLALLCSGPFVMSIGTVLARPGQMGAGILQLAVFVALAIGAVFMNQRVAGRYAGRLKALEQTREVL